MDVGFLGAGGPAALLKIKTCTLLTSDSNPDQEFHLSNQDKNNFKSLNPDQEL